MARKTIPVNSRIGRTVRPLRIICQLRKGTELVGNYLGNFPGESPAPVNTEIEAGKKSGNTGTLIDQTDHAQLSEEDTSPD